MNLDNYIAAFAQQSPTAAETISRLLRQAILDGALPGGSVLRQEEMARKFGVSRIPIREALLKLEGEGLVEAQPRRGVVVTALSPEDFEEILDMRLALESLAIELAAPRFQDADVNAALRIVDEAQASVAAASADPDREFEARWGSLNWSFHKCVYAVAGRPRLLTTIENLHHLFARHMRMRIQAAPASADDAGHAELLLVLDEHRQLVRACGSHDVTLAKAILQRHITNHGSSLVSRLRHATAG